MRTSIVIGVRAGMFLAALAVVTGGASALAADPIPDVGPAGDVQKVAGDFGFTEGPAWDGKDSLYFTDVQNARIHKVDAEGAVSVFAEETGPCNGLMFNQAGELMACNMGGQLVAWNVETKEKRVLASEFEGKRFNAPNDLVIDAAGGVYFTDPPFRAPQPLPQPVQGVYYLSADGKLSRVVNDAPAPNGVLLSRDEKTLYVLPSMSADMQAYPVEAPGQLGALRTFCTVKTPPGRDNDGCDGATIDERGNLYLTTALGVQVFNEAGEALGVIEIPERPSNCTFGGADGKTLYVTARTSLYAVPMHVKGHWFAQPKAAEIVRIRAGSTEPYTDKAGNIWAAEEGFEGGLTIDRDPGMEIENTEDDELYRSEHYSMDSFTREVPNGKYLVKLHFAETFEGIFGPGGRVFSFTINGQEFKDFDIWVKAGGAQKAYVETVPVDVTDGKISIKFDYNIENPAINAIEIHPAPEAEIIRIRAGSTEPYTDKAGNIWAAEEGFEGGLTIDRDPGMEIENTEDDELYRSEHYSMDSFTRELPNGKYQVKLHFAETFEGIFGAGDRVFSFAVNGKEFKDFDIWQKSGGAQRAYIETVDVEITDGKLEITFTPGVENPEINGIEIIPVEG
jgi:gluconolactonase